MFDRTYVTLYILKEHLVRVREILECHGVLHDALFHNMGVSPITAAFEFEDVNYGDLPFLDELQQEGIAYISYWEAGDKYGASKQVLRFTPEGEAIVKKLYDSEENPPLYELMEHLNNPDKLIKFIKDHHSTRQILPWDNQVEYGKKYRLMRTIGAT